MNHDQENGGSQPIVVGVDGGEAARAALLWAADECRTTGSELRVVYVWQMSAVDASLVAAGATDHVEALQVDARARATRWVLDTLGGTAAAVRWSLEVREGPVGPTLVTAAARSRLLVIGAQSHVGVSRALHGSVSHYCLSHSPVPVVGVPARLKVRSPAPADVPLSPGPLF